MTILSIEFFNQATTEVDNSVFDRILAGKIKVHPHSNLTDGVVELREQIQKDLLRRELSQIKIKDNMLSKIIDEVSHDREKLKNVIGEASSIYIHPLGMSYNVHYFDF